MLALPPSNVHAWAADGSQIMFTLDSIADEFAHPSNGLYVINAPGAGD